MFDEIRSAMQAAIPVGTTAVVFQKTDAPTVKCNGQMGHGPIQYSVRLGLAEGSHSIAQVEAAMNDQGWHLDQSAISIGATTLRWLKQVGTYRIAHVQLTDNIHPLLVGLPWAFTGYVDTYGPSMFCP